MKTALRTAMNLGIDFDNTIVCYDRLFHQVAAEQGLIPAGIPATKEQVRDYLRACGREKSWTELQGYVYAKRIVEADAFPGVIEFFRRCRETRISAFIVSHKTRYPFEGPQYDLHAGARLWLERAGFFDRTGAGLDPAQVYFEPTKARKLARIGELSCSAFVDDLPEFLAEPGFPAGVTKVLFDPWRRHAGIGGVDVCALWEQISDRLLPVTIQPV